MAEISGLVVQLGEENDRLLVRFSLCPLTATCHFLTGLNGVTTTTRLRSVRRAYSELEENLLFVERYECKCKH